MSVVYITQQGAVVSKQGERLIVSHEDLPLLDQPLLHVSQVVLFGNISLTAPAASLLLSKRIEVVFLSSHGRYKGRLQPECSQTVDARRRQYLLATDPGFCLRTARVFIQGKIHNALQLCLRQRDKRGGEHLGVLRRLARKIARTTDIEALRGYEGTAAATYFARYRQLLKYDLGFTRRVRRPPTDPVNALLSLGYTLLFNNVHSMVNLVGLDPYQGFFHSERAGHAALVSDLMEEFRPLIVDSVVLWVINSRVLGKRDFVRRGAGVRLKPDGLKKFLKHYEDRLQTRVLYPRRGERLSYLQIIEQQARLLVRVLRSEDALYESIEL